MDNIISFPSPLTPDPHAQTARENHLEFIRKSFKQVEETLIQDLAKIYRLKAAGQPVGVPEEVTLKDVIVRLS